MKTAKSREAYCSMASIRYAKVLFDLEVSEEAIMAAEQIFEESPELVQVLQNPVVTLEKKHKLIDRIFDPSIRNFLKVVTDHGKAGDISEIFAAYRQKKNEMSGIVTAHLVYVTAPTDGQKKEMEKFICDKFHARSVEWNMEKRPGLIGGFLLHVNGREYDYSIKGRLKRLEQKLTWR